MRTYVALLMVGLAGCSKSPTAPSLATSAISITQEGACHVPSIVDIDVNMAGPQLVVTVEQDTLLDVERLDNSGGWVKWQGTPFVSHSIDVWFDQQYRVRARFADCASWSPWTIRQVGPANPSAVPTAVLFSAGVCTDWVFAAGVTQRIPLVMPAGTYRIDVETRDAAHHLGYQSDQTQEVITLQGVGTTEDIPEADESHVTSFTTTLPALTELVIVGGRDSVHGVCITLQQVN